MNTGFTADSLFRVHHHRLALRWTAGREGAQRQVQMGTDSGAPAGAWVGHLNLIHPNRVQVLGEAELRYLEALGKNSHADAIKQLFAGHPAAVIIADGQPVPREFTQQADDSATPLFATPLPAHKVVTHLHYYITHHLADKITLHGVFMEILGIGVLITGESGIGKSELALELINRGHRLVADDAPEFARIAPDTLNGRCPSALQEFLEVRGLGVLNIRAMFGDSAIKPSKNLRLIIHLERMDDEALRTIDRLQGSRQTRTVLEVEVPQVTLPVAPGHNLAVLAEGAARNHILALGGYDAAEVFMARQRELLEGGGD
ncbi:MAG TPA: HPr kinase/phosphorylase [Gammaproteobacteria bacterium]|nr:HPr kinase/phosphorylase [Gammaproteobacteria bacterium]